MKTRILLADDHVLFLEALRTVLSLESDMEVVGQAQDGAEVLQAALALHPDVVCMDVNMPAMNGVDATRALLQQMPAIKIIGLSGYDDSHIMAQIQDAGAVCYIAKSRAGDEVVQAIRQAMHSA